MLFHNPSPNLDYHAEDLSESFAAMIMAVERTSVMAGRAREINLAAQHLRRELLIVRAT